MFSFYFPVKKAVAISLAIGLLLLSACTEQRMSEDSIAAQTKHNASSTQQVIKAKKQVPLLEVYKSPTCRCCQKWISHIDQHGFSSKAYNQTDLSAFKKDKGIAPQYRSCHTAVSKNGYVFEGHVPAKFIHQFLANPPADAIGLAVPAMPLGTPGMDVGDRFRPYHVVLLKADGSSNIYAKLNSYQEQF
jgi:hypothetical protein